MPSRPVINAAFAACVAVAVLWAAMSLTYPFGWDQGLFAWVGGVIVQGGMPYRDAWDFKGPLVYYVYAAVELLCGRHLWSIRLVDLALLAGASVAVARLAARLAGPRAWRWTVAGLWFSYASRSYWHTAQPDAWTGLLLAIGFAPLLASDSPTGIRPFVVAGACIGLTVLFKPVNAIWLLVPLAHSAGARSPRWIREAGALVATGALPPALAIGWFWTRGGLDALMDATVRYAALYVLLSPAGKAIAFAQSLALSPALALALPLAAYGVWALRTSNRPVAAALGSWLLVGLAAVIVQGRFFAYQWLPLLPATVVLSAVGVQALATRRPAAATTIVAVLLIACAAPVLVEERRFIAWCTGRMTDVAYYDGYGEPGKDMRAVAWLDTHGQPGDVFVFGWHSDVAWLSGRQVVSRFGYSLPLLLDDGMGVRARYRTETMAALRATPPRYILVGEPSTQILGRRMTIDDFPDLAAFVRDRYHEVATFESLAIHEIH